MYVHLIFGLRNVFTHENETYLYTFSPTIRVVFNLIPTPCKADGILSITIIRIIKYGFMRVTSQTFNTALYTLETRKSRCHSLVCYMKGCVTNYNSAYNSNVMYTSDNVSKFSIIFHSWLMKGISCYWKWSHWLLFICRVCPKRCIKISNISSWEPFVY